MLCLVLLEYRLLFFKSYSTFFFTHFCDTMTVPDR